MRNKSQGQKLKQYQTKKEYVSESVEFWYKVFKNDNNENIINGTTPKEFFDNIWEDNKYKFLSLFINRLHYRGVMQTDNQKEAMIIIINEIYDCNDYHFDILLRMINAPQIFKTGGANIQSIKKTRMGR